LGLGTESVPYEIYSKYQADKEYRETRGKQILAGLSKTGYDTYYPNGVDSPLYTENVDKITKTGGSVFIGGVGGFVVSAPEEKPIFTVTEGKTESLKFSTFQGDKEIRMFTPVSVRTEEIINQAKQREISETIASARSRGEILSTYEWIDADGNKVIKYTQPVRDYSLIPKTPSEKTEYFRSKLVAPIAGPVSATIGAAEDFGVFKVFPGLGFGVDLVASSADVTVKEAVKLTAGSYYQLEPKPVKRSQLEAFKALSESQQDKERKESASFIATTGVVAIAFETVPIIRGLPVVKDIPMFGKSYAKSFGVPETQFTSKGISKGEGANDIFNPIFIEKGTLTVYNPNKQGIFKSLSTYQGKDPTILVENPTTITTRVMGSKPIDKLPSAIGTPTGLITDITEGATVKIKRTATVYKTEGTPIGSGTSGYSFKGEIYGTKGSITSTAGELGTVQQQIVFVPKSKKGEFKTNLFIDQGTVAATRSIPIKDFGVGRTTKGNAVTGVKTQYSTGDILGVRENRLGSITEISLKETTQAGYKTFGMIKTDAGKPIALTEYFSQSKPKPIDILPDPKAFKVGGRGGMKQMQIQIQDQPTTMKTDFSIGSFKTGGTQTITAPPTFGAFSVSAYDKPQQGESVFAGTSSTQRPTFAIGQPSGNDVTQRQYVSVAGRMGQASYSPTATKAMDLTTITQKGYIGIKTYTPEITSQKVYQPTGQKVYQPQKPMEITATKQLQIPYIMPPTITTIKKVPIIEPPPPPIFGGGSMIDLGGFGEMGKRTKPAKGKYQPSFTAMVLGIRGKAGNTEKYGFAIRPIVGKGKGR
jgi:hypothetical protein